MAAVKALTEGGVWKWNPAAIPEGKRGGKKRVEEPLMRNPWTAKKQDPKKPSTPRSKTSRVKGKTKKSKGGDVETTTVHSPWDLRPMAAPAGSKASAGTAPPVSENDTGVAAAAAAITRTGASTTHIRLEPSRDLPRKERSDGPKTRTPKTRATPTLNASSTTHSLAIEPQTPSQDDDPDRIDDVV